MTRAAPGAVKRLSVAVLLREPEKGRRTAAEINQITQLVRSAVGYDQARNDQVTVISRKFAGEGESASDGPAWYDNSWLPVIARNVTAIVIALLVLLLGVRPLAKALMKKKEEAEAPSRAMLAAGGEAAGEGAEGATAAPEIAVAPPVTLDEIEASRNYDERIGKVRGFTRDNPARAALAVRDMMKATAQ